MNSPSSISREVSPDNSPYESRRRSVSDSPKISPKHSPMVLKRSDAYRNKTKKVAPSRSIFDLRKKNDTHGLRSKSVSEISHAFQEKKEDITSNRSSISEDSISEERESDNSAEPMGSKPKKGTGLRRRQSFQTFIGAKLNHLKEDYTPRLTRSSSFRMFNKQIDNEIENKLSKSKKKEDYEGPLFLATTLFVPGYDFDAKKKRSLSEERKPNMPLFARRGSKDKILPSAFNRNTKERKTVGGTPTLFQRASKEKLKLNINKDTQVYDTSKSCTSQDPKNVISSKSDKNDKQSSSFSSIREKQNQLKAKYKQFEELGTCNESTYPIKKITVGKVRNLSTDFESGSIFVNKTKKASSNDKELSMLSQQNEGKTNKNDDECEFQNNRASYAKQKTLDASDVDKDINDELKVANNDVFLKNDAKENLELDIEISDDTSPVTFGGESGYASPTDLTDTIDINFEITRKNLLKSFYVNELQNEFVKTDNFLDPMANINLSNSWSHGQWKKEKNDSKIIKRPDIRRVIRTDLCVTEL